MHFESLYMKTKTKASYINYYNSIVKQTKDQVNGINPSFCRIFVLLDAILLFFDIR